jgi:hypothetical protein
LIFGREFLRRLLQIDNVVPLDGRDAIACLAAESTGIAQWRRVRRHLWPVAWAGIVGGFWWTEALVVGASVAVTGLLGDVWWSWRMRSRNCFLKCLAEPLDFGESVQWLRCLESLGAVDRRDEWTELAEFRGILWRGMAGALRNGWRPLSRSEERLLRATTEDALQDYLTRCDDPPELVEFLVAGLVRTASGATPIPDSSRLRILAAVARSERLRRAVDIALDAGSAQERSCAGTGAV